VFSPVCCSWLQLSRALCHDSALVSLIPFSGTQFFRLTALVIVFAAAISLHIYTMPFRSPLLNRLEFASLALGFLTLALGLFFSDSSLPDSAANGLTVVLMILHIAFVLLLLTAVLRAAKCCGRCKSAEPVQSGLGYSFMLSPSMAGSEPLLGRDSSAHMGT
jgi:hypothetical protein